jgi:hypothetical protein
MTSHQTLETLQAQLRDVQRELDDTIGSLASLNNMNKVVGDFLETAELGEKHIQHMKASDQIFSLEALRLRAKNDELIRLLLSINIKLIDVLETLNSSLDIT